MRKFSFLALLFTAVFISKVQAQSFTDIFDTIFVNVSRADATTGILYDRVIPVSGLQQFSCNNPDTTNMYQFLYGFHELYNAAFDISKRLPYDGDSLEYLISNNTDYVDIGILHYRFNVIDTLVAQQTLYLDANNVLYENRGMGVSLYNEDTEDTILLINLMANKWGV